MSHKRAKVVFLHKLAQGRHVIHVKIFRLAAARLRVKNAKVLAPMDSAVSPIAR